MEMAEIAYTLTSLCTSAVSAPVCEVAVPLLEDLDAK